MSKPVWIHNSTFETAYLEKPSEKIWWTQIIEYYAYQKAVDALKKYESGAEYKIKHNGKEHFISEFGCGCCANSYDVDTDGTKGTMNCEIDDVAGKLARDVLKELGEI